MRNLPAVCLLACLLALFLYIPYQTFLLRKGEKNDGSFGIGLSSIKTKQAPANNDNDNDNPPGLPQIQRFLNGSVSNTVLSPPHNQHNGQIDWSQYGHMMMYHTRKAGGSSLFVWAKKVAKKHNLTISQEEGFLYNPKDWKQTIDGKRVFVFTSLRPPVDRIVSSFEYDWLEQGINNQVTDETANLTLKDYVRKSNEVNENFKNKKIRNRTGPPGCNPQKEKVKNGFIWICSKECYSKWFGGWTWTNATTEATKVVTFTPNTEKAAQRLNDLEIVWLYSYKNPQYMEWLLHRWDAADIPMVHVRSTNHTIHRQYSEEDRNILQLQNEKDELLYEALRRKWSLIANVELQ